ncbi:MAG: NAD(P)H-dependent oxidoreductase [Pseudomonadota bacterium]
MQNVLVINSSANVSQSKTRDGVRAVTDALNTPHVVQRDLAQALPHITEDWATARLIAPADRTTAQQDTLQLSDTLIDELKIADTIVIGMPIYNFSVPAALKAWIDLIARPKVTFQYTANGPEGLLQNKRAIIVAASGGVPIGSAADFATPYLKHVLAFVGITDVTVIDSASPDYNAHIDRVAG